ncbi:hypothetical protein HK104_002067 [Borealophlyctis nickersoniae]|nr:hypothetical protein HK104_002067 [Borealophlyctis nickersoniae]
MHATYTLSTLSLALVAGLARTSVAAPAGWTEVPCTYHDYEGDKANLGAAYDNSPGWCGIRYSALNAARITAIDTMHESLCGKCLEIASSSGSGPSQYVLAIDQKGAPGLDVARTSFAAAFPGSNPLDPQSCMYRIVADEMCAGVCFGSAQECTPGVRNLLPAYLLPPVGSGSGGQQPQQPQQPTTTTTNAQVATTTTWEQPAATSPSTTTTTTTSAAPYEQPSSSSTTSSARYEQPSSSSTTTTTTSTQPYQEPTTTTTTKTDSTTSPATHASTSSPSPAQSSSSSSTTSTTDSTPSTTATTTYVHQHSDSPSPSPSSSTTTTTTTTSTPTGWFSAAGEGSPSSPNPKPQYNFPVIGSFSSSARSTARVGGVWVVVVGVVAALVV